MILTEYLLCSPVQWKAAVPGRVAPAYIERLLSRHGCPGCRCKLSMPFHFRRICHASPAIGGIASYSWVAFGKAVITPERRLLRTPQGSPASPWEAVRKYHYFPIQVAVYRTLLRLTRAYTLIARPACLTIPPFSGWCPGGAPYSTAVWFLYPQYRVFSFQVTRETRSTRLSLSV